MTKTINITQEILDSLSSGNHTLKVTATTASGFSASDTASFSTVTNPAITVDADLGTISSEFSFDMTLSGINDTATVRGFIDNVEFYRLNNAYDGTFTVTVSDNMLYNIGGGEHEITFSLTDAKTKRASSYSVFTKTFVKPVVSVPSNLGDKIASFPINYSILNAKSEHPSLVAYMDSVTDVIYQTSDASTANSFTVNVNDLSTGSHTVIIAVTNDAGTTTKNVSFNKAVDDGTHAGLKLGYLDDTWDDVDDRIFAETTVRYQGVNYKSFEDSTPYQTKGEVVTGSLLAAFSRGVQDAGASNLTKNNDGTFTEVSANGVSIITPTETGYTEVYTDKEGNVLTKNVFFNADGSVAESISYERA